MSCGEATFRKGILYRSQLKLLRFSFMGIHTLQAHDRLLRLRKARNLRRCQHPAYVTASKVSDNEVGSSMEKYLGMLS